MVEVADIAMDEDAVVPDADPASASHADHPATAAIQDDPSRVVGNAQPDAAQADAAVVIASETDLESFCRQPLDERTLTGPLRGVLAETAITGVVRYKWSLLRPLVEFAMEQVRAGGGEAAACRDM